jgi:hypothetical protein
MKIQKDNLTPKQKRNAYLGIIILSVFIFSFFYYKSYINENRRKLLSENTETTFCRIIGSNTHKTLQNHLEYNVGGKKYEIRPLSPRIFIIGEFYEIKYSKSNPEIAEVDYKKPIILNKNDFDFTNGIITKTFEKESLSVLKFSYNYQNEKYDRDVILEKIGELRKGKRIKILVNKEKPEISYLVQQIKAE